MPPKAAPKGAGDAAAPSVDTKAKDATNAMFHQLELDKINVLTRRYDECRSEKERLQRMVEKGEKDTHEFVAYFQRELEDKDETISKRNEELAKKELESKKELEETKSKYESQLLELTQKSGDKELALTARLKVLEEELHKLDNFKESKDKMEEEIQALKDELKAQEDAHMQALTTSERKFLEEKAKMQKDMDKRADELRKEAKIQVQNGLDADTRKVIAENKRMKEELRFQQEMTDELQEEKTRVEQENKLLKRDLALAQDKEEELHRQIHQKTKEIQAGGEKILALEELLKDAGKKFQAEKSKVAKSMKKDLEESTLDAAGLRQLLKLKNRELQHIKTHARTILDQRTETEQFFLDALDECKREIAAERQRAYQEQVIEYRKKMASATKGRGAPFPKIRGRNDGMMFGADDDISQTKLPVDPGTKVHLSELSWTDKDRVLRLLFAKINAVQGSITRMPGHSLREPHPPGAPNSSGVGLPQS